jgi:hypothetical protein
VIPDLAQLTVVVTGKSRLDFFTLKIIQFIFDKKKKHLDKPIGILINPSLDLKTQKKKNLKNRNKIILKLIYVFLGTQGKK